jgi:DNA-directed RNA polymerase alpha subunit
VKVAVFTKKEIIAMIRAEVARLSPQVEQALREITKERRIPVPLDGKECPDDTPISNLYLSVRAHSAVFSLGHKFNGKEIETVGELCAYTEQQLRCCRNCGSKTIRELVTALALVGRNLKP